MTKDKQKGFTIIEVALVLAVAALIFLVVFLAVPALQRNQRDDARKRDVSNVVAAISAYNGNNTAKLATEVAYSSGTKGTKLGAYLDNMSNAIEFVNVYPATSYTPATSQGVGGLSANDAKTKPGTNAIVVFVGGKCGGNNGNVVAGSARGAAVVVQIEAGGTGKYFCQDAS